MKISMKTIFNLCITILLHEKRLVIFAKILLCTYRQYYSIIGIYIQPIDRKSALRIRIYR